MATFPPSRKNEDEAAFKSIFRKCVYRPDRMCSGGGQNISGERGRLVIKGGGDNLKIA